LLKAAQQQAEPAADTDAPVGRPVYAGGPNAGEHECPHRAGDSRAAV